MRQWLTPGAADILRTLESDELDGDVEAVRVRDLLLGLLDGDPKRQRDAYTQLSIAVFGEESLLPGSASAALFMGEILGDERLSVLQLGDGRPTRPLRQFRAVVLDLLREMS